MKKYISKACLFFCCLLTVSCFAQKKESLAKEILATADSIEYYEVEIGVRQKNYREWLAGNWSIDTMHRQAKAKPEALSNVSLSFLTDSTFSGTAGCSKIEGIYRLKGTGIKFLTINTTESACEQSDWEAAMMRLLTQTVSAYTVEYDLLLLRDGSSNIVFRGRRKTD